MWVLFLIFAFLAGLALPIQFSINAQLRTVVGSPLVAATISFIVGAITLFTVSLFKAGFSLNKGIASAPWWVWTGGVLGSILCTCYHYSYSKNWSRNYRCVSACRADCCICINRSFWSN